MPFTPLPYQRRSEPLPDRVEDVTAGWIERTLQLRYPGLAVTDFRIVQVITGHTTKVRAELGTNAVGQDAGLPRQICLKANWSGTPMSSGICALEAKFYRHIRDNVIVPAPIAFYADWDDGDPGQGLVIMEDLAPSGGTFSKIIDRFEVDDVARTLEGFADLHSSWWDSPELDRHDWLVTSMAPGSVDARQYDILAEFIAINLRDPTRIPHLPAWLLDDPDRLRRSYEKLVAIDYATKGPRCLLHGDASPSNSYLMTNGRRLWLDWQLFRKGHAWRDVTYFMVSSLSIEDRRANETALLRHYLDALKARGIADVPSFDDFFVQYRRWPMWGMVSWLSNMDSWGQLGLAGVERVYAAAADLDTLRMVETAAV